MVDFHTRLLRAARRPGVRRAAGRVGADGAQAGLDPAVRCGAARVARRAVRDRAGTSSSRTRGCRGSCRCGGACAEELGVAPRFVTMLRHPAAVIDSKQRWYGEWQGDVARAAGWVQQTLFTERATRDSPRVFVRYEDLLDDWTRTVARVGEALDLAVVRDAPAAAMRDVHGFVDRGLSPLARRLGRPQAAGGAARAGRRGLGARVGAGRRGRRPSGGTPTHPRGSTPCARPTSTSTPRPRRSRSPRSPPRGRASGAPVPRLPAPALRVVRRVPRRYRHSVPLRWRVRVARALARGS